MGRTRLIKKLKSKGIILLIAGIIISLISTLMSVAFIIDGLNPILIAFIIMLICGIIFIYNGVDYLKRENSKFIKKHPEILELADDLDINKVLNLYPSGHSIENTQSFVISFLYHLSFLLFSL